MMNLSGIKTVSAVTVSKLFETFCVSDLAAECHAADSAEEYVAIVWEHFKPLAALTYKVDMDAFDTLIKEYWQDWANG